MPFNESNTEETLDPQDWTKAAILAHKMIDDAITHISGVRDWPA